MRIYSPDADLTAAPSLAAVLAWITSYLTAPHPQLGRGGAVCPYVRPALQAGRLYLAEARLGSADVDAADRCLDECRRAFADLPGARQKALVVSFPEISAEDAPKLLGGLLRRVKPKFVSDGLMLGPVYPDNDAPGAHNPAFRPMRGPLPLVAIRLMMESDLPFLSRSTDPPELQAEYLAAYLRHVGPRLSPRKRERLAGARP
jgi:hypothetical protein